MSTSPLPQPAAQTCPNCGAAVGASVSLCPNCGASVAAVARNGGFWSIIGQIALAIFALGSGIFGACFIALFGLDPGSGFGLGTLVPLLIGAGAIAIAALSVRQIIKMNQRK